MLMAHLAESFHVVYRTFLEHGRKKNLVETPDYIYFAITWIISLCETFFQIYLNLSLQDIWTVMLDEIKSPSLIVCFQLQPE